MQIIRPEFGSIIPDILNDLKRNADRNIFTIKTVPGRNGLFGLQFDGGNRIEHNNDTVQFWYAKTENNCNIVKLPASVTLSTGR